VDKLLNSPHERVRDFGREHLRAVASQRGLETMWHIISVAGTFDAVAEIEVPFEDALAQLDKRDLYHTERDDDAPPLTYEDVKGQDPFAGIVEAATASGRVDIVRWLFSERRRFYSYRLTDHLLPRYAFDEDYKQVTPTYEEFGRNVAASHGRPEFGALYDLLRLTEELIHAVRAQSSDLITKIVAGATVSEIEAASTLVIVTRSKIPDDLISDRRSGLGLPDLLARRSANPRHGNGEHRIDGLGYFTVINLITILGHVHLLDWLLTMQGVVGVDEGLDMLKRSVTYSNVSEESAIVQQRLIEWLGEEHNYTDFSRLSLLRNDDHDDSKRELSEEEKIKRRSTSSLPDSYYTKEQSLLDAAAYHILRLLSHDRKRACNLERIWASIELLVALQPPIPCSLALLCEFLNGEHNFHPRPGDGDFIAYRTQCEAHILRLLQLFSARGHDLSAPVLLEGSATPIHISRLLLDTGWLGCLEWLVLERHPNITVQTFQASEDIMLGWGDEVKEWCALNQRKLSNIWAKQHDRWQAAGRPRDVLCQ
jgi:hypothetical protein